MGSIASSNSIYMYLSSGMGSDQPTPRSPNTTHDHVGAVGLVWAVTLSER